MIDQKVFCTLNLKCFELWNNINRSRKIWLVNCSKCPYKPSVHLKKYLHDLNWFFLCKNDIWYIFGPGILCSRCSLVFQMITPAVLKFKKSYYKSKPISKQQFITTLKTEWLGINEWSWSEPVI